uniref:Uncharacterized protein n=1 Tax=Ditylenchus dipsaci TaxID=166011 RepID=A0A915ED08_9BILA
MLCSGHCGLYLDLPSPLSSAVSRSSSSSGDIDASLEPREANVSPKGLVDRILGQLPLNTPTDVRQTITVALSKIPVSNASTPIPPMSPETPQPTAATPGLSLPASGTPDSKAQIASHVSAFQRLLQWLGYAQKNELKKDASHHTEHSKEHDKEHHEKEHSKEHHKKSHENSHDGKKHHSSEKMHKKPRESVNKLLKKLGLSKSNESDESKHHHHNSSSSSSSSSSSASESKETKETHKGGHKEKHFGHRDSHEFQKKYGHQHSGAHSAEKSHKKNSKESAEKTKYKDAIKNLRHVY